MRRRTIEFFLDGVMWYLLYLLPVVAYLILLGVGDGTAVSFSTTMSTLGLDVLSNSPVYTALNSIFGADGIIPLFASADLIHYFSYFVCVLICHLFVDFLLFIPRLAHKWLEKLYGGD